MIRSTLRTTVRQLLGETTASFWSDAMLNQWIEDGQLDIVWRTKCKRTTNLCDTTASTLTYRLSTLVPNILRIADGGIRIYDSTEVKWEKLAPKTKDWLDQNYRGWELAPEGIPLYYVASVELDELIIYPVAESDCVGVDYLKIEALIKPIAITSDSNSPDLPTTLHLALIDYVVATGLASRGYADIADKSWSQYYAKIKSYMIERDYDEDTQEIIMRPNYRGR